MDELDVKRIVEFDESISQALETQQMTRRGASIRKAVAHNQQEILWFCLFRSGTG